MNIFTGTPNLFGLDGHLTEEGMLELAKNALGTVPFSQDAIRRFETHKEKCESCRRRWNEYYIEWCS